MTAAQTGEETICVGCGLCCDGTLHGAATVQPGDEAAVAAAGLEISQEGSGRVFLQPCPRFSCGSCSIYAARPSVCRSYSCALLINVEAGTISPSAAREKIATAKKLLAAVNAIEPDLATPAKRSALAKRLNAEANRPQVRAREKVERALRDVVGLQRFLIRWFFEGKRGFIALRATAIAVDGWAIVLLGDSSANSENLRDRVIADQACVVAFDGAGRASVTGAPPRRGSWMDPAEFGETESSADELFDEFDAPLGTEPDAQPEVALAGLYIVVPSEDFLVERLTGVAAADAVFASVDRGWFSSRSWLSSARLARAVPVFRASLPADSTRLLEHAAQLTV